MCGICGVILGGKRRRQAERDRIGEVFADLLEANEPRGRDASGFALLDREGGFYLMKRALPPSDLVREPLFRSLLADGLDHRATILLGHARRPTRGPNVLDPLNNQPIRRGDTIGIHNGTIFNANPLALRYGLERLADVDSEVLVSLAELAAGDWTGFLRSLENAQGCMSSALVRLDDPQTLYLLRGDMPLALRWHPRWRALLFSSLDRDLDDVLAGEPARRLPLDPMTGLVARVAPSGLSLGRFPVRFRALRAPAGARVDWRRLRWDRLAPLS